MLIPLITLKEARKILNTKEASVEISLDLGISVTKADIIGRFVHIKEQKIPLEEFERVKEGAVYIAEEGKLSKLAFFSDETNFYYKLIPTADWPTIALSSTPMHRHTRMSPRQDTLLKIKEVKPVRGKVLDTCCGLGYTAIIASEDADEVYTFERDKNVIAMARLNPHSQILFAGNKIKLFEKDIFESIKSFENSFFDRIIHDPPTFKYSPELYSSEFYAELFRVMKKGGILYHYAPSPQKMQSRTFYKGMIRRLQECGFAKVQYSPKSSGVRAVKI
jgi:predicted methyltransferase